VTVDPSELAILDARRGPRTEGKRTGGSAGFVFSYRRATRAVSSRKDGLGRPVRLFERTDEDFGDTMFGGIFLVAARSACCSANSLLYVFVAQTGLTRGPLWWCLCRRLQGETDWKVARPGPHEGVADGPTSV